MIANLIFTSYFLVACKSELDNKPSAEVRNDLPLITAQEKKPPNSTRSNVQDAVSKAAVDTSSVGNLSMLDGSTITFVGSKMIGDHSGGFNKVTGSASLDEKGQLSALKAIIDMQSTFSDHPKLTKHLKNDDFFDVPNHPIATFSSTTISDGKVTGILNLRGKKNVITFPATIKTEGNKSSVQAEFTIKRTLWGINYTGKKDNLIKDDVLLKVNVEYGSKQ